MKKAWIYFIVTAVFTQAAPAAADSSGEMLAMIQGLKDQVTRMQATVDEQSRRIQQLESKVVLEKAQPEVALKPAAAGTATEEADFQKNLKKGIGEMLPWLKGLKQSGDVRLRMENLEYFDKNNDAGSTGTTNDRSRNRFRARLRWGVDKDLGDDWKTGFRLTTGTTTEPTATNQTLGNSGYFTYKNILIDRIYATYEPSALKDKGVLKSTKIGAGKVENPFQRYSTIIVWDPDVSPEGLYEQADWQLFSTEDTRIGVQTSLGQFLVNENAGNETDAQLFGYQGVATVSTHAWGMKDPVEFATAVSYYDYPNWFQTVANNSASTSYLRTNSIVADNFRVIDVYPAVSFQAVGRPVTLWYDYASNLANVGTDDVAQSGGNDIHDMDEAWGAGFKIGKAKKKGSWELAYGYYEIGANAVVAAFADSDFGGPAANGYTNRKGHKLALGYQLTDSVTLNWTGYLVRPLNPFNGNSTIGIQNSTNEDVFRSQLDLLYKF